MAVSYGTTGTVSYSTGNPAPTYPASIAAGDLLVLIIGTKPGTAATTTPSGWTSLGEFASTTGTTGIDTGPMRVGVFYKVADGTESGTLSVASPSNNVSAANIYRWTNATGVWDVSVTYGEDTAGGTSWSAACTSAGSYDFASGDGIMFGGVIPTDVTTPAQFSAEAVTASGATFAAATEIQEWDTTSGQDMGAFICRSSVSSGSSTSAPTVTATAGGTTTNVYGPSFVLRVREAAAPSAFDGTSSIGLSFASTSSGVLGKESTASVAGTFAVTADGVVSTPVTEYPIMFDGSIDLDPISILQLSNTDKTSLNLTPFFGDFIMLATPSGGAVSATADVPLTFTLSAAGTTRGSATRSISFAVTASGTVATSSTATVPLAFATSSAGSTGLTRTATVSESFAVTAAGSAGLSRTASVPLAFAVAATGSVGSSQTASVPLAVATTASGTAQGQAAVTQTVTVTAAGDMAAAAGGTVVGTFTITAEGSVSTGPVLGEVSLTVAFAITASGILTRLYFSAPAEFYKRGRRYGTQDSWWLSQGVGVTVWRKDGQWHSQISPPPWVTEGADRLYVGGRKYEISLDEQADLVAAGFGAGIYTE